VRTFHWFDFETSLPWTDGTVRTVRVEATVSSGEENGVEIEGIKVRLLDSAVLVVPTDQQLSDIRTAIFERCSQ
jgi:hypothetical protein